MSSPFIGEVRIFGCNFAPRSWAFCNGQLLPIAQNTALFSILGTTYGGDGRSTFGLPDLQARVPMHPGRGPGLTARRLGERGGVETVTLTEAQLGNHNHGIVATDDAPTANSPANAHPAMAPVYEAGDSGTVDMSPNAVAAAGGGQAHNNIQPILGLNFVIALQGLYPSRS